MAAKNYIQQTPLQNNKWAPHATLERDERKFLQNMGELEEEFMQTHYFEELKRKIQDKVQIIDDVDDYIFGSWGTPQEYHLGHLPEHQQESPNYDIYKDWESFDLCDCFLKCLDRDAKYVYRKDGKLSVFGLMAEINFECKPRNPQENEEDVEPAFEQLLGKIFLFSESLETLFCCQMMYKKRKKGVTQKLIYQLRLMTAFVFDNCLELAEGHAKDSHTKQDLVLAYTHYVLKRDKEYLVDFFDL